MVCPCRIDPRFAPHRVGVVRAPCALGRVLPVRAVDVCPRFEKIVLSAGPGRRHVGVVAGAAGRQDNTVSIGPPDGQGVANHASAPGEADPAGIDRGDHLEDGVVGGQTLNTGGNGDAKDQSVAELVLNGVFGKDKPCLGVVVRCRAGGDGAYKKA